MTGANARPTIRRHEWLLAGIAAIVVFVVPMTVVGWLDDPQPEIRVLDTSRRLSVLVIDDKARVLILNTDDREAAGALLGRIAQPWEPQPKTLVAPSSAEAAMGVWEALQRLDPSSIVIAGIPGADPLWSAIEAESARRNIDLRYVTDRAIIEMGRLNLTVFGASLETDTGRGIVVRRENVSVVVALDAVPPQVDAQALIMNGDPDQATPDLLVTSDESPRTPKQHEVLVDDLHATRLVIEEDAVRVFGGVLRSP